MQSLILTLMAVNLLGCSANDIKKQQSEQLLTLGTQQIVKGNYTKAQSQLSDAENLDPENPVIKNNLGLVFFVKNDLSKSENYFKTALALNPKYSDARNNLARVYIELTRYDDAIKELQPVIADLNYSAVEKAYINLGLAYQKKGEINSAVVQYQKAISANRKFCPAHNYYGQALFSLQKYELALESFETALKLCNNNYEEAHYYRGLTFYKVGQTDKAIQQLQDVIKLYPGSDGARKSKQMLQLMRPERKE